MDKIAIVAPVVFPDYCKVNNFDFHVGAAANKIRGFADAFSENAVTVDVVSVPVVTAYPKIRLFKGYLSNIGKWNVRYLPVISIPGANRIFSFISLLLFFFIRFKKYNSVIFYNYYPEYIGSAFVLKYLLGRDSVFVDLEDGVRKSKAGFRSFIDRCSWAVMKRSVSKSMIVVSRQLAMIENISRYFVVNGFSKRVVNSKRSFGFPINVLYGGLINNETGVDIFCEAIQMLCMRRPDVFVRYNFTVTGYGDISVIESMKSTSIHCFDNLFIRKNLTQDEYNLILGNSDIGLQLRVPTSDYSVTTFPSKVIEISSAGLLLITTDISDLSDIYDDESAVFLEQPIAESLFQAFCDISDNPDKYFSVARKGTLVSENNFYVKEIGKGLVKFMTSAKAAD